MFKRNIENQNLIELRNIQQQIEKLNFQKPNISSKEMLFKGVQNLENFSNVLTNVLIGRLEPDRLFLFFPPEYIKHMGEYLIDIEKYYYDSEKYKEELSKLKTKEAKIKKELRIK